MLTIKSHWGYIKYLSRHKWYVFLECCRYGMPLRGFVHDWTKFLPSEWIHYTRYFYGNESPGNVEVAVAFDMAWNYHQKRNPHHWQYWILTDDDGTEKLIEMPLKYVYEMVSDWIGVSRAYGKPASAALDWYEINKHLIRLEDKTRRRVEILLRKRAHREEYEYVKDIGLL